MVLTWRPGDTGIIVVQLLILAPASAHHRVQRRQPIGINATRGQPGQQPVAKRLTNQPGPLPAARRNKDSPWANCDPSVAAERSAEKEVFHERQPRKTAQPFKPRTLQEKSLIT